MIEFYDEYDILESIVTDTNSLLKSIAAEEVDVFYEFEVDPGSFQEGYTIEQLYEDDEFNEGIDKKDLKKSPLESSKDIETFLEKTIDIKYFFVYKKNQSELENPQYIIIQSKDKKESIWEPVKGYKVKDDINNFFNKLTTKKIEIKRGNKIFIYSTSNSGNDWVKMSSKEEDIDEFKEFLTNQDIKKILKNKNTSITILA